MSEALRISELYPLPNIRRLEIGPASDSFEICVADGTPLKHPDIAGKSIKAAGRCKIHEGRSHWRVNHG